MKIVHIVLSSGADYADNWAYQENTLPEQHSMLGNDVTLITSTTSSLVGTEQEVTPGHYYINGVKIIRLKPSFQILKNRLAIFNNLKSVLEEERPDIIFLHGFAFLSLNKVKSYKDEHKETMIVYDCHATYENSMNKLKFINKYILQRGIWKSIYQKNKEMFSRGYYVAPQVKTFLKDMYDVDDSILEHLPMGARIPEEMFANRDNIRINWCKRHNIATEKIILITGGRFREIKKLYELLMGFNKIDNDDLILIVFGKFEDTDYEKKSMDIIESDKRIRFIGWLNNEETQEAYLASDLAVFPGSQSVIWRTATACGLPMICHYSDGAEEMDLQGNCLFIYEDNPMGWAQMINVITRSKDTIAKMKEVAETSGHYFFSEERIAKIVLDDYKRIIDERD